ncbi:MAG: hypothetical protein ACE5E6_12785, partial [Phycisphaerae bacterium]
MSIGLKIRCVAVSLGLVLVAGARAGAWAGADSNAGARGEDAGPGSGVGAVASGALRDAGGSDGARGVAADAGPGAHETYVTVGGRLEWLVDRAALASYGLEVVAGGSSASGSVDAVTFALSPASMFRVIVVNGELGQIPPGDLRATGDAVVSRVGGVGVALSALDVVYDPAGEHAFVIRDGETGDAVFALGGAEHVYVPVPGF